MDDPPINVTLEDMKHSLEFIRLLQNATLDKSNLPPEVIERIRDPPNTSLNIEDADILFWIEIYIAVGNASEETYNAVRAAVIRRYPDMNALSLYKVSCGWWCISIRIFTTS